MYLVTYFYRLAYCKRNQSIRQVGNAHNRGGNCVDNKYIVRYSQASDGSTFIDKSDGRKENSVENPYPAGNAIRRSISLSR